MAIVNFYNLNPSNLDLSNELYYGIAHSVDPNVTVNGAFYPSSYDIEMDVYGQYYIDIFAGNFSTTHNSATGADAVTGGTVSAYYEYAWNGSAWVLADSATGFSYSAVAFYDAGISGVQSETTQIVVNILAAGPDVINGSTFEGLDYVASYADLINAFRSAGSEQAVLYAGVTHFVGFGYNEGRKVTFDGLDYIASYGDLIKAFGANGDAGAYHYIESGHNEGRTTTFDGLAYIAQYTDLMHAFGANNDAGASHYIESGHNEGRSTAFDVAAYESAHPDLIGIYASHDAFLTAYIDTYNATGRFLT
jgi:hypothetical protein